MNFYQPVCILKTYTHQNNWQVKRMQSKQKKKKRKKKLEFLKVLLPWVISCRHNISELSLLRLVFSSTSKPFQIGKTLSILSEERFSFCEVTSPWGLTVQLSGKEIIYMYIFITMLSHKLQQAILRIPYSPCTINECVLLLNTAIYVSFKVG